jgi:hypothetical protein
MSGAGRTGSVNPEPRKSEGLGRNIPGQLAKRVQPEDLAACGSPGCAGCYDVGDGVKIHPPRSEYV